MSTTPAADASAAQLRAVPPAPWIAGVAQRRRARQRARIVVHHLPGAVRTTHAQISVVVLTRDRREELIASLERLWRLAERPHVVVVDDGSVDGTADAVLRRHPWVELLVLAESVGAAGRNLGVDRVTTPFVAFADDDTWWAPGSLATAADVLEAHPAVAAVTATIRVEPGGRLDPIVRDLRVSPLPDEPGLPGHPLLSILAGASALRAEAFRSVGGFEPRLVIGGEEELLSADLAAAGWALRHVPELVIHHAPSTARDAGRRRVVGLRNTLWFAWLRRPMPDALRRSLATLRTAPHDRFTAAAVAQALAGSGFVARERRRLPRPVADGLRRLDVQQLGSQARRYVS